MPVESCAKDLPESDSACAACEASSRVVKRSVQVASSALCEHISRFAALVALPQWKRRYLRASVSSRKVSCTGDSKKKRNFDANRGHMRRQFLQKFCHIHLRVVSHVLSVTLVCLRDPQSMQISIF